MGRWFPTRRSDHGLIRQGQGIAKTNFVWPKLAFAPRSVSPTTGLANSAWSWRRHGLFYDRPNASTTPPAAGNPPRHGHHGPHGQLRAWAAAADHRGCPALAGLWVYERTGCRRRQWNGGVQTLLPWAVSLDVCTSASTASTRCRPSTQRIDFGAASPRQPGWSLPAADAGRDALSADLLRAMPATAPSRRCGRRAEPPTLAADSVRSPLPEGLSFGLTTRSVSR